MAGTTSKPPVARKSPYEGKSDAELFGSITHEEVAVLRQNAEDKKFDFDTLQKYHGRHSRKIKTANRFSSFLSVLILLRRQIHRSPVGAVGIVIVFTAVCIAITMFATILLQGIHGRWFTGGMVVGVLTATVSALITWFPSDSHMQEWQRSYEGDVQQSQQRLNDTAEQLAFAKRKMDEARRTYKRISDILNSRLNQLLGVEWRALRGIPFEEFLQDVFEAHGYSVSLTKASGDQGVDLIVQKGADRVAVQAKGYVASVGNAAVQQAHSGMSFHGCSRSAVITNSVFTSSARELAQTVDCQLIGEDQMPGLIRGEIQL